MAADVGAAAVVAAGIETPAVEACPLAVAGTLPVAADYKEEALRLGGHQGCTWCTCFGAAAEPMGLVEIDSSALKHTLHSALVRLAVAGAAVRVAAACWLLLHVAAPVHQERAIYLSQYDTSLVARKAL